MNKLQKMKRAVSIVLVGFSLMISGQVVQAKTQKVKGTEQYEYAYEVLKIVNKERSEQGYKKLVMDEDLLRAAMLRAAELDVSFSHTRPNGTDCFTACQDKMYGENIAWGYTSPKQVMQGWMDSSGHRANIMNSSYKSIGIGCLVTKNGIYWVQCFGYEGTEVTTKPANRDVTYQVAMDKSSSTKLVGEEATESTTEEEQTKTSSDTPGKVSGLRVTAGKKKLTVKWNKMKGIDGYQIQISTDKSFKKKKTYAISATKTKKVINTYNNKKLKKGKKYYVRIRAYVKGDEVTYGNWKTIGRKVK